MSLTDLQLASRSNKVGVSATGSKWRFGEEAPDKVILHFYSKKYACLGILWSKFLLKTHF